MTCSSQLRGRPAEALLLRITNQSQQLAIQTEIVSNAWAAGAPSFAEVAVLQRLAPQKLGSTQ